ncbi:OmpA family protein [Streptosporangium sandarakinum]|uniref:Outer membrane protein OmpA-like peptidoglycan-associated protein n=1 Tax=Streptosporangium sandarakinum TaxID=1260955 RepID=A0A852UZK7_9ACTN|nr:OmpA family protein [Streptosporangium sandarakinum]NYF43087.1 outer membrane protein OmpA-like peptidoglycan-associated protein [Streptosporangium sandarakinum]
MPSVPSVAAVAVTAALAVALSAVPGPVARADTVDLAGRKDLAGRMGLAGHSDSAGRPDFTGHANFAGHRDPTVPAVPPGATTTVEDLVLPAEDLVFPVEDLVPDVESLDGGESESRRGDRVTVALTSDVLFALDRAALTSKARQRLRKVAERIRAESAGGTVEIGGHTDDQGSDAYNLVLSRRRAHAVRRALGPLLTGSGMTLKATGYGEARPRFPNVVEDRPMERYRAKNRRVEIVFRAKG